MIVRMPSVHQRVALVTGSSRGLGSAIARRLAEDGLAVAVNGLRDGAQARAVVDAIQGAGGVAGTFAADVTDELQVAELVAAVADGLGPVDVLVLNATGPQPEAPLPEVGWEDHLAQLEFFVKSPVLLGRAVLPGMQVRRWGRTSIPPGTASSARGASRARSSGTTRSSRRTRAASRSASVSP